MADPVFGQEDRVETPSSLPPELVAKLQGKTAPEQQRIIIDFYQGREKTIIQKAKEAIRVQDSAALPNDQRTPPVTRVNTERQDLNSTELDGARQTLIAAAVNQARIGKKYWDRFDSEIKKIMDQMDPQYRVNFQYWETAYYNLVGANKETLDKEEKDAEVKAAQLLSERANAAPELTVPDAPLHADVTGKILPGLGINEKQYREGQKNIAEGRWPLTFDKAGRP
jgi:hypothetical protein